MYARIRSKVLTTIRRHQAIGLMLFFVVALSGCASHEESSESVVIEMPKEPESISLLLACAPASSERGLTRLADEVVQLNSATSYRPITNLQVYAIKEGVPVNAIVDTEQSSDVKTDKTQFYHFKYCNLPTLTNGCLVYAKAEDVAQGGNLAATLKYNGSLNTVDPSEVQSKNDIQFSLESILDATEARESGDDLATWEREAWNLAKALTAIVNNSHNEGNTLSWKTSTNAILKNLLQRFTNNGADLPGSAASVKQWMLSLKEAAETYYNNPPATIGDDEKTILNAIMAAVDGVVGSITVNATSYPRDVNLPDGAAALRWTGNKFVPQMQTTTLDDINSVSRFVYPPALYYFVESGIWTSNSARTFNDYKDKNHWKATSENDAAAVQPLFSDGGTVMTNTKTVAIADPLQYAVAHLTMEVKAGAAFLPYETGNEDKIDITKLTLKGVIIGGQRSVGYDFKPISNSLYDVNFVYDSQVSGALNTAGDTYHTLVLQSYDGEDVNIILEFEYSPEATTGFKCLNGYVYPGTRFYLVGEKKMEDVHPADADNIQDYEKRFFTQDHTTSILLTVKSLEKAYNVLPSLLSSSLEIGVMITPQWISAEPSGPVVLD